MLNHYFITWVKRFDFLLGYNDSFVPVKPKKGENLVSTKLPKLKVNQFLDRKKERKKEGKGCDGSPLILMTCLPPEGIPKLIPEEGSTYYHRVQHYRELLDSLQMDAYTHGCILHPEITVDSHIPAYAATCIRSKMFCYSHDSPHHA